MKKLIYYHRHGETIFSARDMVYGDKEYETLLTEKGRRQVTRLGTELVQHGPFDLYLSSPLPRAVQTATIIQSMLDMELQIEPALIEGIKEHREDIWQRVEALAVRLIQLPELKILLSTHGFICCCLAAYFRGENWRNMSTENPPTASFGWIELEDGLARRACRFSTAHLELQPAATGPLKDDTQLEMSMI